MVSPGLLVAAVARQMLTRRALIARRSLRLWAAPHLFGVVTPGVNLFFASLLTRWLGLSALTAWQAAACSHLLGMCVTWIVVRHIERMKREADME